MLELWEKLNTQHHWLANWLSALLIAIVGFWLIRILSKAIYRVAERAGVDDILSSFLRNLVFVVGLIVVFIAALDLAGVPTSSLLAVLGAAGLAIGLALKDSLSNIASGLMLIFFRPFRTGDSVQIASLEGIVERVKVFQTFLRTPDNRHIILPNSLITAAPIINLTTLEIRRIEINFRISNQEDVSRIRSICQHIASNNDLVLLEPSQELLAVALVDTLLELQWRIWVAADLQAQARSQLLESLLVTLRNAEITLPAPKREMWMINKAS